MTDVSRQSTSLDTYLAMSDNELEACIEQLRREFGKKLLILGHHYQRSEIIRHADLKGDSFALSRAAAESRECDHIVFCGVHFMAETAYLLANSPENLAARNGRRVQVSLSEKEAGCTMADMATESQLEKAWAALEKTFDITRVIPVTYVNSTAAIKAFCGKHGGLACTSSNAMSVLQWAFARGDRIFFLPDQMLGINTALKMGILTDEMAVWSRQTEQLRSHSDEALQKCRIILWDGCCGIHLRFTCEQIDEMRAKHPGIQVIVHPECHPSVIAKADFAGSTSQIIDTIAAAAPGSVWAVGTEWHLVERLAETYTDRVVLNLGKYPSVCRTMAMTRLAHLCHVLETIKAGTPANLVTVDDQIADNARLCLERMLAAK